MIGLWFLKPWGTPQIIPKCIQIHCFRSSMGDFRGPQFWETPILYDHGLPNEQQQNADNELILLDMFDRVFRMPVYVHKNHYKQNQVQTEMSFKDLWSMIRGLRNQSVCLHINSWTWLHLLVEYFHNFIWPNCTCYFLNLLVRSRIAFWGTLGCNIVGAPFGGSPTLWLLTYQ